MRGQRLGGVCCQVRSNGGKGALAEIGLSKRNEHGD